MSENIKSKAKLCILKCKIKSEFDKINGKIKHFFSENYIEIVLFLGLFFIILASFLVNLILGLYVLGTILFLFAIFLLKFPSNK